MNTWICLRGLTREAAHWGRFAELFRAAQPDDRVLMIDLPGNGVLHDQRSPATVADMATACCAELARQGVEGPVHLLAMSLGAMVATQWALDAPEQVAACVLINTSFRPYSPFTHRLRPRNYGTLLRLMCWPATPEAMEAAILRITSNHAEARRGVLADWVAIRRARPVSAGNALRQLLAAARFRAPAQAPCRQTLLLNSARDGLVDAACSQAIAQAWGCPLRQHPDAGHDLPLDDPEWVVRAVRDWRSGDAAR